jgi:hypothetical protein
MKYALLMYAAPDAPAHGQMPADDRVFADWESYTRALKDAGVVVGAERLRPADTATSVRWRGGERLVTDGPFIETKEHLLGFYLLDVADLETALDWVARMPLSRDGTVEVRPVIEGAAWRALLD